MGTNREREFTIEVFLRNLRAVEKMGKVPGLLEMIPGMGEMFADCKDAVADGGLGRIEAIARSMTAAERRRPEILDASRRDRVAGGAGSQRRDVDEVVARFERMKRALDRLGREDGRGPLAHLREPRDPPGRSAPGREDADDRWRRQLRWDRYRMHRFRGLL